MINKLDYITYEYNQILDILIDIYKNSVAKDQFGNPNISKVATDKALSWIKQDTSNTNVKTGVVRYPFILYQLNPTYRVDNGGQYDYPGSANSFIEIQFYDENQEFLYKQKMPVRVQPDWNSLSLNMWTYSYQQQQILRDITNRYFALPRRINHTWDITSSVLAVIYKLGLNISKTLLQNLHITYLTPFYLSLQGAQDTTSINVSTEVPITKFTYTFDLDVWVPTDIELDQILELIKMVQINYFEKNTYIDTSVTNIDGTAWNQKPKIFHSLYNIK